MRLKLKAKRRRVQWEPRHQVDMRELGEQNVEEFRRVLAEALDANPKGDVEEVWSAFKKGLREAQRSLPLVAESDNN